MAATPASMPINLNLFSDPAKQGALEIEQKLKEVKEQLNNEMPSNEQGKEETDMKAFASLNTYLNYFVPIDNLPITTDQQGSLWRFLSTTTTTNYASNSSNQSNNILPSLFKASMFQPHMQFNQNISSIPSGPTLYWQGEHFGSIEWKCNTFLLILTELWFGDIPAPKTNYILRSTNLDDSSINNIQPYSANINHMISTRIIIKHLHYFSNSFTYNPVGHANNRGLAEIKQTIWTSKYPLQKKLYKFIKVAFNRWPFDYTFRQPLEAWLSYIQPWRYVKTNNEQTLDSDEIENNKSTYLIENSNIDNHWRNFILDNLPYYTVIFGLLMNRLLQADLSSSRNALMLFRVIKVYSQPRFLSLVRDAEEAVMRNNLEQSMNMSTRKSPLKNQTSVAEANAMSAKLLAPTFLPNGRVSTPKTKLGALEHHLESDSELDHVSLFSQQTKQHLVQVLMAVQHSRLSIREFVQSVEARTRTRNRGWFESIRAFLTMEDTYFESQDERDMYKDKQLAEEYLNFVTNKISQCFEVQIPDIDLHNRNSVNLTSSMSSRIFFN